MRRCVLLLSLVLACGGSDTTTASVSITGTYVLKTINGAAVPATFRTTAAGRIVITDDEFTLNADHTYSELGHFQTIATNGTTTTAPGTDTGTYSNTNGAIQLHSTIGNGDSTGSITGTTLTITTQGAALVYTR